MVKNKTELTRKIYSEKIDEWNRLFKDPFHKLEFDTSMKFLSDYLPKSGLILDAGGGPGRYTIELAKKGYEMALLDLVPKHLEVAKKKIRSAKVGSKVKKLIEGTISDLAYFNNNSFDAVICLGGVLSHVAPLSQRKKAVMELTRVAKKAAPIFISVMGKFGTISRFMPRLLDEVADSAHFRRFYLSGDDLKWHGGKESFAHFFELDELKSLLPDNVEFIKAVGLQGLASSSKEKINLMAKKNPKAWKNWLQMHYCLCSNPAIVDTSLHFMVIARKK